MSHKLSSNAICQHQLDDRTHQKYLRMDCVTQTQSNNNTSSCGRLLPGPRDHCMTLTSQTPRMTIHHDVDHMPLKCYQAL